MKRILVAIALGALSSSVIFAAGACTGPGANTPSGTQGELNIYGAAAVGADINNVLVQSGTILGPDMVGSCVVNGSTFSNFQVVTSSIPGTGSGFTPPTTGFNLELSVLNSGTEAAFSYNTTGAGTSVGDIELFYQISGPGVTSMTLGGGSAATVTENICGNQSGTYSAPQTGCAGGDPLASQLISVGGVPDGPVTVGSATVDYVSKDITGGSEVFQDPGTSGGVPEPMSLSLMGIGLLGIGLLGRRARS